MSVRLAAYAVCIHDDRVLLARTLPVTGRLALVPVGGLIRH